MKPQRPSTISDQLRQAILAAEISQCELSRRIGLDKSVLSRFMRGLSGLSIQNIDRIGKELGLELTPQPKQKGGKGR